MEGLPARGYDDAIVFEASARMRRAPVEDKRLQPEFLQRSANPVGPIEAKPFLSRSNVDEEILIKRKWRHPPFFLQSPGRGMGGDRDQLGFGRIDIRAKSNNGLAEAGDRLRVVRSRGAREKEAGGDENKAAQQGRG